MGLLYVTDDKYWATKHVARLTDSCPASSTITLLPPNLAPGAVEPELNVMGYEGVVLKQENCLWWPLSKMRIANIERSKRVEKRHHVTLTYDSDRRLPKCSLSCWSGGTPLRLGRLFSNYPAGLLIFHRSVAATWWKYLHKYLALRSISFIRLKCLQNPFQREERSSYWDPVPSVCHVNKTYLR